MSGAIPGTDSCGTPDPPRGPGATRRCRGGLRARRSGSAACSCIRPSPGPAHARRVVFTDSISPSRAADEHGEDIVGRRVGAIGETVAATGRELHRPDQGATHQAAADRLDVADELRPAREAVLARDRELRASEGERGRVVGLPDRSRAPGRRLRRHASRAGGPWPACAAVGATGGREGRVEEQARPRRRRGGMGT